MLKVKIVSTSVRTRHGAARPAEARPRCRAAPPLRARGPRRRARAARSATPAATPQRDQHSLTDERPGPRRRRTAPHRSAAPTSWLTVMKPDLEPRVRDREIVPADEHRQQRARRVVAEDLGRAEHERARRAPAPTDARAGGDRQADEHDQHAGAEQVGRHDDEPAVDAGRTARRPHSPNSRGGSHWNSAPNAISKALCVSEATSSGPAAIAMPSPVLLSHDEASSQRKPGPRRRGATASRRSGATRGQARSRPG